MQTESWYRQIELALQQRGLIRTRSSSGVTYYALPDVSHGPRCTVGSHVGQDGAVRVGEYLSADIKPDPSGGWSDVDAVADDIVSRLRDAAAAKGNGRAERDVQLEELAV